MYSNRELLSSIVRGASVRYRCIVRTAVLALFFSGCTQAPEPPASQPAPTSTSRTVRKPLPIVLADEQDRALTAEETAVKQQLETQLAEERPTHRLRFRSGRVVEGHMLSQTPVEVRLRDGFGYSGYIVETYKRADIASIETLPAAAFEVTARDVRFRTEFPQFHFVKIPPYTILTDESYGEVQRILALLKSLREQFVARFAPLIKADKDRQDIHVVFFGSEENFHAYAQRAAPAFVNSAGFYSSREDRLALLNQLGTARYAEAKTRLDERGRQLSSSANAGPQIAALRSDLTFEAKAMNERLIRHEGAHQLFHAYGIHSRYGIEPTWLTEGLAEYCEPAEIGRYHFALAERITRARERGQFLPLKTLLNHRDPSGFFALGESNIEVAYAESWALVYMLMQDDTRERFLNYLKSYRDLADDRAAAAQEADPAGILDTYLKTDFNTLERQWDSFVSHM